MNMGEKIKRLRESRGMTLEQLGDLVGVGKSTVRKWENGMIANMRRDKISRIADALNVSPAYLMGWSDSPLKQSDMVATPARIPVLGNVAAGVPINMIEEIIDYEEIPEDMASRGEYFGLVIHGDSMEPKISEGDVVIVRCQDDVESGQIAIITINGDDATCKRVIKYAEGITLISNNSKYQPMEYSNKEIENLPIRIIGRVVELRAKF